MPYNNATTNNIVTNNVVPAVIQVLNLLGDATTFTRVTPGSFNPANGSTGTPTTITYTCQGISDKFNDMEMANLSIQFGDMKYIVLPTDGHVPMVNDTCVITGITYRIMSVLNDNLQNVSYLYTLQLRV